MKKILVLVLISIVLLVLDNTLMPFLAIRTYYPSLLFIFSICYSIINGKWEGLWLGIFTGLLQDLYFLDIIGINAFTNMLVCVLAAILGENIFKEKRLVPVVFSFFLSVLKGIILFVILYINGIKIEFISVFYVALYTMVITIIIYRSIYKLSQRRFMKREWRF